MVSRSRPALLKIVLATGFALALSLHTEAQVHAKAEVIRVSHSRGDHELRAVDLKVRITFTSAEPVLIYRGPFYLSHVRALPMDDSSTSELSIAYTNIPDLKKQPRSMKKSDFVTVMRDRPYTITLPVRIFTPYDKKAAIAGSLLPGKYRCRLLVYNWHWNDEDTEPAVQRLEMHGKIVTHGLTTGDFEIEIT
jgi:hypothetical protein